MLAIQHYLLFFVVGLVALFIIIPPDLGGDYFNSIELGTLTDQELVTFKKQLDLFSRELYQSVHNTNKGTNKFFSPSSLSMGLGLLFLGADGNTQQTMKEVMHLDLSTEKTLKGFETILIETYNKGHGDNIVLINQLWSDVSFDMKEQFTSFAKEHFFSESSQVNFEKHWDLSRELINKNIEKSTNGNIKDLLPAGAVHAATKLIISNAIYFKDEWQKTFEKENTRAKPFHLLSGDVIEVPTMSISKPFRHAENEEMHIVELPYKGGDFSMMIYFPKDAQSFDYSTFPSFDFSLLERKAMDLSMPKFTIKNEMDFTSILQKDLGLAVLFGSGCDLGRISSLPLVVDGIFHQSFVNVDEQGTEAAAATGIAISERSLSFDSLLLSLSHPFIFSITNVKSGDNVFMGALFDPK